jgi:hypothetical protein
LLVTPTKAPSLRAKRGNPERCIFKYSFNKDSGLHALAEGVRGYYPIFSIVSQVGDMFIETPASLSTRP